MLLEKEFFNAIFYSEWEFKEKHIVPNCVYVAEEFAIGFAEWCAKYRELNSNLLSKYDDVFLIEELLEIYKKEKGL